MILFANVFFLGTTLLLLPDWTLIEYAEFVGFFASYMVDHVGVMAEALVIFLSIFVLYLLKDRIKKVLGLEGITVFKFRLRDCLSCWTFAKPLVPIEIYIAKVEDLSSANLHRANNVFIEASLGFNEVVRTRVHNNVGAGCIFKEILQLNYDQGERDDEMLTISVKDQNITSYSTIAKLQLRGPEIEQLLEISAHGGDVVEKKLYSTSDREQGRIWLAITEIHEEEYEVERERSSWMWWRA